METLIAFCCALLNFLNKGVFTITYPEILYQHLQDIIQREIHFTPCDKMIKSPQRKRIVTLQDVANALLYFEGGSLAKELKRAGLGTTPSAFIQRRHQLHPGVFQDVLAALGAQDMEYENISGISGLCGWRVKRQHCKRPERKDICAVFRCTKRL